MWKQNQSHGAKAEALPVNGLEQSGMASCAARLGSIHGGRFRDHSEARTRVPRAHRCSPLSICVECVPRVIVGGGCCYSGARIDERARQDIALHRPAPRAATCRNGSCMDFAGMLWHRGPATVATLCSAGLLGPAGHGLFALGGDRALSGSMSPSDRIGRLGCAA